MHSSTVWKNAPRPNYVTNIDRDYPYSELPFFTKNHLVKIPSSRDETIDHIDYWGEGRIISQQGVTGFPNCYNVNHSYQLVSNGQDKDKKIPNRIPVDSYDSCDTSDYIRDNSVVTVTIVGAPITVNCMVDIARIVKSDVGKVIVFGSDYKSETIKKLTALLKERSLYYCPDYELPDEVQGIKQHNSHMTFYAFLNESMTKDEFVKLYNKGYYTESVNVIKQLDKEKSVKVITEFFMEILKSKSNGDAKIMSFAYTLWNNGGQDILLNHFPGAFKLIFGQKPVMIKNYEFKQPLKLAGQEGQDMMAWGHNGILGSRNFSWRLIPVWSNNEVTFKLNYIENDMFLKLSMNFDDMLDRKASGSKSSIEERHRFYVEPQIEIDGTMVFHIINYEYRQGLKLAVSTAKWGDRKLYGHSGNIYDKGVNRYKWCISPW